MAHLSPDRSQVNARIALWGIPGAGVSTNLRVIHQKLRADHRGELQQIPTRLDPTTHYELLPIELGQVNGLRTQLQVVAVPGGEEHEPTRKQLLDHADGVVFVVDSRPDQIEANVACLAELREALGAYGRSLDELPIVVQYNKRDESDPYTIEELHRRLDLPDAAVFEAVAQSGKGVLQTLTTISKRVIRVLRELEPEPEPEMEAPALPESAPAEIAAPEVEAEAPAAQAGDGVELMERAILAEGGEDDVDVALEALDGPWDGSAGADPDSKPEPDTRIGPDFELVSVGQAQLAGPRSVQLPVVFGSPKGETLTLRLTVSLDPLLDGDE